MLTKRGAGGAVRASQRETASRSTRSPPKITQRSAKAGRPALASPAARCLKTEGTWLRTVIRCGGEELREAPRRGRDLARNDDRAGPRRERPPQLPDREVEVERVEQRPAVGRAEVEQRQRRAQQRGHVAVADQDPLGVARRARGVDDVGRRAGARAGVARGGRRAARRRAQDGPGRVEHPAGVVAQALGVRGVGQHARHPGVAQHVGQPGRGVGGVERHVGAAQPERGQDPRHQVGAARQREPDPFPGRHPGRAQPVRQRRRRGVELGVRPDPLAVGQRGRRGRAPQRGPVEREQRRIAGARVGRAHTPAPPPKRTTYLSRTRCRVETASGEP